MRRHSPESVSKRIAICVIALCALVLQGIFPAATARAALAGEVNCAEDASGSGSSSGEHRHHHESCCIVACAGCCPAYVASLAGPIDFPIRPASHLGFGENHSIDFLAPLEFYFSARGPPQTSDRVRPLARF